MIYRSDEAFILDELGLAIAEARDKFTAQTVADQLTLHDRIVTPLEELLLAAIEDYQAEGSLSETDVDRWAFRVVGQMRLGVPIGTIQEDQS